MDKPKEDDRLFKVEMIYQETASVDTYKEQGLKNALIRAGHLIEIHASEISVMITQQQTKT